MTTIRFLADHDLNEHIIDGVVRREPSIDFLRVRDFGMQNQPDAKILEFATSKQLIVVSHDVNTMTSAAAERLEKSLGFSGLLLAPQSAPVGVIIENLLMIWSATTPDDWENQIVFLPI